MMKNVNFPKAWWKKSLNGRGLERPDKKSRHAAFAASHVRRKPRIERPVETGLRMMTHFDQQAS
ncbi:hypothetical protein [Thiorhodovibrio winogradskyi]|uniref:hypothetical protein n=1 Tax=Thiorhodovibrio winogradskyi TaxID=77007 RepID=UPI002E2852E1|nr:hypothetical protein [Thiorhodovibrio winogradskyi]